MQTLLRALQALIQLSFFFLLAKFLSPEELGTVAIVSAALAASYLLAELGLEQAVAQNPRASHEELSASFWLSLLAASVVTGILELASPLIGDVFPTPFLKGILQAAALTVPIYSLIVFSRGVLLRKGAFRALAMREVWATALAALVGIGFLAFGERLWSYAAFVVVLALLRGLFLTLTARWHPSFSFSFEKAKTLLRTGKNLQAFGLFNFLGKNIDTVIVGRFLGAFQLGLYNFAYRVIPFFQDIILGSIRQMVLPVYSQVEKERRQLYLLLCRDTRAVTVVVLPVLSILFFHASGLIPVVFGEQWRPAVPIFMVLCVEVARQSLTSLVPQAIIAVGRSELMRQYGMWSLPVLIIAFFAGIPWNALGVAMSFFFFNTLLNIYLVLLLRRALQLPLAPLLLQWTGGLAVSFVPLVSYYILVLFRAEHAVWWNIAAAGASAVGVLWMVKFLFPESWATVRMMTSSVGRPSRGAGEVKPLTVFLDPLANEQNPHLTLLHKGLEDGGENDVRELHLTTFIIQLPLKRLTEYLGRRVAIHLHFVNRFYESRSRVGAIMRFVRLVVAVAWCRMFGVRILWTMHDDGAHLFRYRSVERFFLFCFVQLCDRILTLSERGREILWERYGRTEGIVFTPHPPYNGVYPNVMKRQKARTSLGISPKESLYLFMGRVMPYKGLEELIAVFRAWKPSRKVRLLILGPSQNGEYAARLKELAKEDPRIRVAAEFVSERKIDLYMNAADFGVLPYRRILHSGTTMMFMTFGCPVIVPRLGWFPEIFQNHRIGIMYDSDVPGGLRNALDRSLSEPKKRFQGDIDRFCRSWSLEAAIQLTAGVYRGLQ